MEKRFWMVCMTASEYKENSTDWIPKYNLYRVSNDSPEDKALPLNTFCFWFVKTDKSEEDMLKELGVIAFGKYIMVQTKSGESKIYVIGTIHDSKDGCKFIFNKQLRFKIRYLEGVTIPIDET